MSAARPTVKDVARVAQVSPKTVSNVLTGAVTVAGPTRERVEAAMRELDYVPNLSARSLRNGRSGVIAIALPDLGTPFSAVLVQLFVREAHRRGLAVQIEETATEPDREFELLARARRHQIDGLVLNPITVETSAVERSGVLPPVVLIGEVGNDRADHVGIDSEQAAYDATSHLVARGAVRIGAIGALQGEAHTATGDSRMAGFRRALADAGLLFDPELVAGRFPWRSESGRAATAELVTRARPDALFCFTDSLAIGAIAALFDAGLRVPGDVLVCGVDDVPEAALTTPALTTVGFDHGAYVAATLDLLESRIRDRAREPRRVVIPHVLTVRGSTTPG